MLHCGHGDGAIRAAFFEDQPLCLSLLRKGNLDVVFILILNGAVGVSGIAWATPFADWIAFVISVALIVPQLKRLRTD